ncbi:MAG: hypothetical protein ACJ78Q_03360, partial [Chloroflexia bacterium]
LDAVVAGGGRDRDKVARTVLGTRGYQGASGPITFDERGDRVDWAMTGYNVRGGRFAVDVLLNGPNR